MCSLCMCTVIFQIHDKMMYEEHVYNVLSSHFSVNDKLCQGLKIAPCVSLALVLSFITVWECYTHTHTDTHSERETIAALLTLQSVHQSQWEQLSSSYLYWEPWIMVWRDSTVWKWSCVFLFRQFQSGIYSGGSQLPLLQDRDCDRAQYQNELGQWHTSQFMIKRIYIL